MPHTVQISAFFVGATSPLVGGSLETGVNYAVYTHMLQLLTARHSAQAKLPHATSSLSASTTMQPSSVQDARGGATGVIQHSGADSVAGETGIEPVEERNKPVVSLKNIHKGTSLDIPAPPALTDVAVAAALAGVALSFILSPFELVKCRLQVRRLRTCPA
jgi:hypothetical protein